ncbi:MAG TPA: pirin family protein [Alphaproteobacteria bacterium]
MISRRPADARGRTRIDWLDSRHTFSFADYFDEAHMGFGSLRVINEDRVAPGAGFPMHGHRDMEIISYVLSGALEHKDSLGTGSIIRPGEIQRMSAGTGIRHSEYNPSPAEPVHFLQIWIVPERAGLQPSYEQTATRLADTPGKLRLIGARDGGDGAVTIHQDVNVHAGILRPGDIVDYAPPAGRRTWVQVARGSIDLNGQKLAQGDGAAVIDEPRLRLTATGDAEVILFDLA